MTCLDTCVPQTKQWPLTMITQNKEASSREVRVEFNEDYVRGGVDRFQCCVPTKLSNLRRWLVWAIPGEKKTHTQCLHYKGVTMRWKFPAWTNFPHRTMADKCQANTILLNYSALSSQINGYLWAENVFSEARDTDGRHLMIFTIQNMKRLHWLWIESDLVWQSVSAEGDCKSLGPKFLLQNNAK